jgi:hypothetical protein
MQVLLGPTALYFSLPLMRELLSLHVSRDPRGGVCFSTRVYAPLGFYPAAICPCRPEGHCRMFGPYLRLYRTYQSIPVSSDGTHVVAG